MECREKYWILFLQFQAGRIVSALKIPACKLLKDDTKQKYLPDVGEKYCLIPL